MIDSLEKTCFNLRRCICRLYSGRPVQFDIHDVLGGATVNVAAGISRLGASSAFITVTGDDATSEFVREELRKEGVDLSFAKLENDKRVSGVYIHLTDDNDRIFHTYIDETPDIQVETPICLQRRLKMLPYCIFVRGRCFI